MHSLGVKMVQKCHFEGITPVTSCCTPKGTITAHSFLTVFVYCSDIFTCYILGKWNIQVDVYFSIKCM